MAGKHLQSKSRYLSFPFSSTPLILLLCLSLLVLATFLFYSPSSSLISHRVTISPSKSSIPRPNYSFVSSLETFLTSGSRNSRSPVGSNSVDDWRSANELDDAMRQRDTERFYENSFDDWTGVLRVYVYDMPDKFTYDLLWLFRNTYKNTENLTSNGSPVHRLIEQHSIDYWLWADLIAPESERLLKNVVRVHRQEDADLFYIPFFSTISYFFLEKQQCKALYRVWAHVQGGSEVGDRPTSLAAI